MKKSKKKNAEDIFSLNDDTIEEECFGVEPEGEVINTFSFASAPPSLVASEEMPISNTSDKINHQSEQKAKSSTIIHDNRTNPFPNGITPPINGEPLNKKRSYLLRESTIRKINKLVACDPDVNVYVSTIVDKAINHYYEYIISQQNS